MRRSVSCAAGGTSDAVDDSRRLPSPRQAAPARRDVRTRPWHQAGQPPFSDSVPHGSRVGPSLEGWRRRGLAPAVSGAAQTPPLCCDGGVDSVARVEQRWGAARTRLRLERVHGIRVNTHTIQRVFRDIGIPFLTKLPRRRPRQLTLFEKEEPGESVQVDVKVVKLQRERLPIHGTGRLRASARAPSVSAAQSAREPDFFRQVQAAMPFPIRKLRCDHGARVSAGVRPRPPSRGYPSSLYIKPSRPQQDGEVERSHRVDDEELCSRHGFEIFTKRTRPCSRGSTATTTSDSLWLDGRTRAEKLRNRQAMPRNVRRGPRRCPASEHAPSHTLRGARSERRYLTVLEPSLDYSVHRLRSVSTPVTIRVHPASTRGNSFRGVGGHSGAGDGDLTFNLDPSAMAVPRYKAATATFVLDILFGEV